MKRSVKYKRTAAPNRGRLTQAEGKRALSATPNVIQLFDEDPDFLALDLEGVFFFVAAI
ncbi:MAG: hypothetical protein LBR76_05480 [Oscillospiraceae bacterium]|jgi:hypothetical protein|nr:hypothetical protein [Oscillospiraceae bacterium]